MFRGCFEHALDSKGRVNIPAHFRETLSGLGEDRLIIAPSLSDRRYLQAYPVSKWRELEEKVRTLPQFDPHVEAFRRIIIAGAMECPIDRQGRILLPPLLREHAGISKEMVFAGDLDRIQIWAKPEWLEARAQAQANIEEIQKTIANLGL